MYERNSAASAREVMIVEVEIAPIVGVEVLKCEGTNTKMMRWDEKRKNRFRRALL